MRRKLTWLLTLLLVGAGGDLLAQTAAQRLSQLMADKLRAAQKLMEGIALADYDKITKSSDDLIRISNSAEWFALKTPRYELHSNEFRRSAEVIAQKARAKNLDGVTLAYVDMMMSCVRCHQYVREVRDAE